MTSDVVLDTSETRRPRLVVDIPAERVSAIENDDLHEICAETLKEAPAPPLPDLVLCELAYLILRGGGYIRGTQNTLHSCDCQRLA